MATDGIQFHVSVLPFIEYYEPRSPFRGLSVTGIASEHDAESRLVKILQPDPD